MKKNKLPADLCFNAGNAKRFLKYNIDLEQMGKGTTPAPNALFISNRRRGFIGSVRPGKCDIESSVHVIEGKYGLRMVLTFEGSMDVSDWLIDGMTAARDGIHSGFRMAYRKFVSEVIENKQLRVPIRGMNTLPDDDYTLKELLSIIRNVPGARLVLTGHSYGGALAQCMTYYAISEYGMPVNRVITYTFASPIPFTYAFIEKHIELQDANVFNIINIEDMVPDIGVSREHSHMRTINLKNTVSDNIRSAAAIREGGYSRTGCNIGTNYYYDTSDDRFSVIGEHHMEKSYMKMLDTSEPVKILTCAEIIEAHRSAKSAERKKHPVRTIRPGNLAARFRRRNKKASKKEHQPE